MSGNSRFRIVPSCCFPNHSRAALPPEFEFRTDPLERIYYLDHNSRTTNWDRPFSDISRSQLQGIRGRVVSMLPEAANYAYRNRDSLTWGFSIRVQGAHVFWPDYIDDLRSGQFVPAPRAEPANQSQNASSYIVIEAIKALTGDENPALPPGPTLPPFNPADLPAYSPNFRANQPSSSISVRLELSRGWFLLSPSALFPTFSTLDLPDRYELRRDHHERIFYCDHASQQTIWNRPPAEVPRRHYDSIRGLLRATLAYAGEFSHHGQIWSDYSMNFYLQGGQLYHGGLDDRSNVSRRDMRPTVEGPDPDELQRFDESDELRSATNNFLRVLDLLSDTPRLPASPMIPPYDDAELPVYEPGDQGLRYQEIHSDSEVEISSNSTDIENLASDEESDPEHLDDELAEEEQSESDESGDSESSGARRRRQQREWAAARRARESPEERAARLERERQARNRRPANQDRLADQRERMQDLRANEPADFVQERRERDRDAHRVGRQRRKGRLLNLASEYDADMNVQEQIHPDDRIGEMNAVCQFCQARRFSHEPNSFCCGASTKTRVPVPVEPPPEILVWYTRDRPEHREFMRNIRKYNNRFAMTSFGCKRPLRNEWDPAFKIQGQVYHRIGSLLPQPGQQPAFLQIYFLGEDEQEERRVEIDRQGAANQRGETLDRVTLRVFQDFLMENNLLIRRFRTTIDREPQGAERLVLRTDRLPAGEHPRRFNAPTGNEVSILIVTDGDGADSREVILQRRDMSLKRINEMHPSYDALQYPLIFWRGNETYTYKTINLLNLEGQPIDNKFVSTADYYCYLLQVRVNQSDNFLFRCGALFTQFIVDMYAKTEAERLRFLRTHQDRLRADDYIHLRDAIEADGDNVQAGQRVILPSTFKYGPRGMNEYMQDAMALVRVYGRPSLFITMTCNPSWPEITRELFAGQSYTERHDIIARVFREKVRLLIKLINYEWIFGEVNAYVYSIEWQKRGLPHIHLLVFLKETLRTDQLDSIISAEIPDSRMDPQLHGTVTRQMIHGPCGSLNPGSVCMQIPRGSRSGARRCEKNFPKEFVAETVTDRDGYPNYRRRSTRDGGHSFVMNRDGGEIEIDNRWVVPYSPFLLKTFNAHINVEYCFSVSAIKYLFKYITKGVDMSMFQAERVNAAIAGADDINRNDEITAYETARYLSASEAAWKFFSFPVHDRDPSVLTLDIHLENYQRTYYVEGQERRAVERGPRRTTLTSFFELCTNSPRETRELLYVNVPESYTYTANIGFRPRQAQRQVGRIYTVHPNVGECYYLRLLLLHVPGPKSFVDIKTVDGHVHNSFREACQALLLLENDAHFEEALREACSDRMPASCRRLFAIILIYSEPSDPMRLWLQFRDQLSEDIVHDYQQRGLVLQMDAVYNECLIRLEDLTIAMAGKIFGTGPQDIPLPATNRDLANRRNHEIVRELNYDREQLNVYVAERVPLMTPEQREIFEEVTQCVERDEGGVFFLDAPGGTGKTFLLNLILARIRSEGKIALACASSGIAATLIDGGRTAHTTFSIPLKHSDPAICKVTRGTNRAELLESCSAIIWDEATMSNKLDVEAVDRTMRDIRQNNQLFGKVVVLFSGDFRQCLPVVPKSTPAFQIFSCLKRSHLWRQMRRKRLTRNMRVQLNNEPGLAAFAALLLRIGGGTVPTNAAREIEVNAQLCVPLRTIDELIAAIFPELAQNVANRDWIRERAILAPLNRDVDELNTRIQNLLPQDRRSRVYFSVDWCANPDAAVYFPTEVLNNIQISNFPVHRLELRHGSPIILIRNIDPPTLCNGTRLSVIDARPNVIIAEILTGPARGDQVLIPRIKLVSDEDFTVKFYRRQFPVRLAYAMTINKAQGQTLRNAGLYLYESECFSHGQLYVACSRVGRPGNLFILTKHGRTRNEVYQQVLQD